MSSQCLLQNIQYWSHFVEGVIGTIQCSAIIHMEEAPHLSEAVDVHPFGVRMPVLFFPTIRVAPPRHRSESHTDEYPIESHHFIKGYVLELSVGVPAPVVLFLFRNLLMSAQIGLVNAHAPEFNWKE